MRKCQMEYFDMDICVVPILGLLFIFGVAYLLDSPRIARINTEWLQIADRFGLAFSPEYPLIRAKLAGIYRGHGVTCSSGFHFSMFTYEVLDTDEDDAVWVK